MNISSRTAAGRSRSADADAFLRPNVVHTTGADPSGPPTTSPYAWKRVLQERIWAPDGPKGITARSILTLLLWHADTNGRVWLGIQAIANKVGTRSLRTVRTALDLLVETGWLKSTAQTWATLTAEQTAVGRPVPRRGDVGQAPNLYVVLDGQGHAAVDAAVPTSSLLRPGLARVSSLDVKTMDDACPQPIEQGRQGSIEQGQPLADPHHDPDPDRSRSRIERVERALRVDTNTHLVSERQTPKQNWFQAWNVIVETHTSKTKTAYGLAPLPPDVRREHQQAVAECLANAATDVQTKLRERTGLERDLHAVQQDLATRVMQLYFKHDTEHLRRVKHALRDLPREFHARITEAMQMLLREHHDAQRPRQTQPEPLFIKTNKPLTPGTVVRPDAAHVTTAREARRLLEALSGASSRDETCSTLSLYREPSQSVPATNVEAGAQATYDKLEAQDKPSVTGDASAAEDTSTNSLHTNDMRSPCALARGEPRRPTPTRQNHAVLGTFAHADGDERSFGRLEQANSRFVCHSQNRW